MLKLASKRPLEQWPSPAQCSPHRCIDYGSQPPGIAAHAQAKRMRSLDGHMAVAPGACPSAFVPAAEAMAAPRPAHAPPNDMVPATLRKRARRAGDDQPSSAGGGSAGGIFFRPVGGDDGAGSMHGTELDHQQDAAAMAQASSLPQGVEDRLFTLPEVKSIVSKALEAREAQLRGEYDRLLAEHLRKQFESFSRYHEDYLSRQLKSRCARGVLSGPALSRMRCALIWSLPVIHARSDFSYMS